MEPIKLTKEQKAKLLEMCKVLFPKQNIRWCSPNSMNANTDLLFYEKNSNANIHWFEFCMGHLSSKILDNQIDYNEGDYPSKLECFRGFICYTSHSNYKKQPQHPVDYLYEEFKKLKL